MVYNIMTRNDQILNASVASYGIDVRSVNSCGKAFCDGADWADSHPHYRKYPEEKPPKRWVSNWSDMVLLYVKTETYPVKSILYHGLEEGERGVKEEWYSDELYGYIDSKYVIAWMKIPPTPKTHELCG